MFKQNLLKNKREKNKKRMLMLKSYERCLEYDF